jgi:hypothetical protein
MSLVKVGLTPAFVVVSREFAAEAPVPSCRFAVWLFAEQSGLLRPLRARAPDSC